jgi:hypothetical protein
MSEEKSIGISSGVDPALDIERSKRVDPTMEKHSHDADEAMKVFDEMQGEAIELDESTNRRLLKIIDWHMMPIMCCIYGMNYLDSMLPPLLHLHLGLICISILLSPHGRRPMIFGLMLMLLALYRNDPILRECHGH